MVNIIIYLRVVSKFDAVQKPKIGIAIPYSFIRQWVKVLLNIATTSIQKKDSILSKQLIFLNILCEINFRAKAENYGVFPKIVKETNQRIINKDKFANSE